MVIGYDPPKNNPRHQNKTDSFPDAADYDKDILDTQDPPDAFFVTQIACHKKLLL